MSVRAVVVLSGCLALAACGNDAYEGQILGTLERDRLELVAESNEPIVEVLVREGDAVQAGATLLRQELGSMRARLDQAVAARNVADRRLAELVKGPRAQEIAEARAALESARSLQETEANEYQRVQDLVSRKLLSQSALDQQRARRDSAAGTNKQATARLNLLLEGTATSSKRRAPGASKRFRTSSVSGPPPARR
jgi:HlyD family secretion protein